MCILRVRRVVQDDDYTTLEVSQSWVFCDRSNGREPCPNTESREQLIRVPNVSALSSPGLMPHDTASSTVSSVPGTPTSGPRFDIRQPFKSTPAASGGNPLRYGHYVATPSLIGRRHGSRSNGAPRPIISQPDPPVSRGRLNRVSLPTGIRDHRRVHSDSEYEERATTNSTATNSTDRATEIIDRSAARERARREQVERNRRLEDIRRHQEERAEREERETALDQEEMRTQRRMDGRERLREENRRRQLAEDRVRDRLQREEQTRRAEAERRREADRFNLERLKREVEQDKEAERRRLEKEEEDERCRRQLEELLDEERRRKARRAQLERELADYQRLEAQLDHAERRRAEEEAYSRHVHEVEAARRAREIRRAENSRLQRESQTALEEELQRLRTLEQRLQNARRPRPMYPPMPPHNTGYVQRPIEAPRTPPFITQGHQGPTLDNYLRQNPSGIVDENIRRAHGENVLDRARQSAERNETAEYRIPLGRRNTIGGNNRARETQYRTMRRYPG